MGLTNKFKACSAAGLLGLTSVFYSGCAIGDAIDKRMSDLAGNGSTTTPSQNAAIVSVASGVLAGKATDPKQATFFGAVSQYEALEANRLANLEAANANQNQSYPAAITNNQLRTIPVSGEIRIRRIYGFEDRNGSGNPVIEIDPQFRFNSMNLRVVVTDESGNRSLLDFKAGIGGDTKMIVIPGDKFYREELNPGNSYIIELVSTGIFGGKIYDAKHFYAK